MVTTQQTAISLFLFAHNLKIPNVRVKHNHLTNCRNVLRRIIHSAPSTCRIVSRNSWRSSISPDHSKKSAASPNSPNSKR